MTDQTAPSQVSSDTVSQALEDQNIFELLGITKATDEEKEVFLDELQQVIWEDFVENDVSLLLTEEELAEFKKIGEDTSLKEDERQGNMIEFLEKLIPDLEKIMLEKALELKEELTRERISDYQEFYKSDAAKLEKVNASLALADKQEWKNVAQTLNTL
ncbi:hypothetical protein H3C66_03720 [Patescibacteria group bacterium]|nr:hypothetical protein [Patescibacteria group bacterium]